MPDHVHLQIKQHRTVNRAGGEAWSQAAELELASLVLTSFVQDQFYRSAEQTVVRLRALVRAVDPAFAARLALLARRQFQLRSISHVLAAEIAEVVKGEPWTRPFYRELVVRADDITAILARRQAAYGLRPLPNSLKRGLADALRMQSEYALAKYASGTDRVHMVDAVNLCRPVETPAVRALVTGTLGAPDTWEVALTRAGRAADSAAEARAVKAAEWERLVSEDRLGYMALLRNLRNIAEHCSAETVALAAARVADPDRVRASRQLPFRFASALTALREKDPALAEGPLGRAVAAALEIAVSNVPELPGKTLVAVDTSGSMLGGWWFDEWDRRAPIETATVFAAALAKRSDADVLLFDDKVRWFAVERSQSVAAIGAAIRELVTGGGTDFHLIFENARERYDRIVILSDMQTWVPRIVPVWAEAPMGDSWDVLKAEATGEAAGGSLSVDALYGRYDGYVARHETEPPATWLETASEGVVLHQPSSRRAVVRLMGTTMGVEASYRAYRRRTGADPAVFCFDLQGYGTTQFSEGRVMQLAGFSEKVFDLMPLFERGEDALVEAVWAVELPQPFRPGPVTA